MESVKKERWIRNTLDAGLVVTESNETESKRHVSSSRSEKDTHADNADINFVNDKQPLAEVQLIVQHDTLANEQQHYVQSEPIYDTHMLEKVDRNIIPDSTNMCHRGGEIEPNAENCQTYKDLYDSIKTIRVQTKDHNDSLIVQLNCKSVENADLKAQIQEKVFANVALKNELRKLKRNSVDTKFAKPSILGKPVLQPPRNQSVVRQPNAFKSERPNFSKPRFASQVDVNNVLSKPVTQHYLPKGRESAFAKPNHMIASSSSRNSSKNMPRFSSNDMVHNHYLEEAQKKTQEKDRNSKTSVRPSAKSQNTTKSCKSKPRSNNQTSRVLPTSKNSCPTITAMQKKITLGILVLSLTLNTLFAQLTRDSTKPVEPTSHTQKPSRRIITGHRFSPNKSSTVHEKINTSRSCLRWIPTGRIFNTAGLRWVPTRKKFTSSTTKVDCEPLNGSNKDITNPYECNQNLNVSAGTLNLSVGTSFNPKKERRRVGLLKKLMSKNQVPQGIHKQKQYPNSSQGVQEQQQQQQRPALHEMTPATISSRLVPNPPPSTPFVPPSRTDWDILFQPMFDELLTPPPSVDLPAPKVIALFDEVVAPVPAVSTGSPSSTIVDQDAPSPIAHIGNDPYFGIPIPKIPSDQSLSSDSIHIIVHPDHQISKHNSKWTKDHPLENIIGELDRPVFTRMQLHEQALFCYYDAFLTIVEPKTYKDALTQSCWIEAMQEDLNEIERLGVWELVPRPDKVMVITLKWICKV
ncbi:hypothetical protein Tco_0282124, partial [Tanacetum coccineum]